MAEEFFSIRDAEGGSLLHHAARQNEPDKVEAWAACMNINVRDLKGNTSLHEAAAAGSIDMIKKLTELNADPNTRNQRGQTPLHLALACSPDRLGVPATAAAVLDAGADPNARDEDGKTPWDLIQENSYRKDTGVYWRLNDARFKVADVTLVRIEAPSQHQREKENER